MLVGSVGPKERDKRVRANNRCRHGWSPSISPPVGKSNGLGDAEVGNKMSWFLDRRRGAPCLFTSRFDCERA
jgi:hypothetical protein